jgi:hypothetical protein
VWLVLAESALVQRVHEAGVHRLNSLLERRLPPAKVLHASVPQPALQPHA